MSVKYFVVIIKDTCGFPDNECKKILAEEINDLTNFEVASITEIGKPKRTTNENTEV